MDREQIEQKKQAEKDVRCLFNEKYQAKLEENETKLPIGPKSGHKFDIYERGKFIGGISTSPWIVGVGHRVNNTGGQDRVSTELLWLSLWEGRERRVMILTEKEMADKQFNQWQGCPFPHQIEIIHCNLSENRFVPIGTLGQNL